MITEKEIQDLAAYLVGEYHGGRVNQQKEDQSYYDDTFAVPMVKRPQYVSRTGTAAWLVDGPSAHIITRNPQAFIEPKKDTDKNRESASIVNALLNHWLRYINKQSPHPLREFVKNLLLRGEAWFHPILNPSWEDNKDTVLPMLFLAPDSLNVFTNGDETHGVPTQVIVKYSRTVRSMEMAYPNWVNTRSRKSSAKIDWLEYWDKYCRYFEADGSPVLKGGIQKNILGFVPFIHSYSGFGKDSPDGNPSSLAVGRLRKVRDLLLQECAINSDIDSTIHKFARPRIDLIIPAGSEFNEVEFKKAYDMSAGVLNIVALPTGSSFDEGKRILPPQEAFQHFYNIRSRVAMEAPPIMSGLPSGTSGRQEDIVGYHYIRRYDSIVEATEDACGKALDMGREILKKVPTWLPITQWLEQPDRASHEVKITKEDLDACTSTIIKLKAADPVEDDRKLMAGRALVESGRIDWESFLIDYAGYTPEKAQKTIQKTIAEKVVQTYLLPFIGEKALEKLGMTEALGKLREQTELQNKINEELSGGGAGSQGGPPRSFNIQTETGREQSDVALTQGGVRQQARQI